MLISLKNKSDQQATQGQAHSFVYWSCATADSVCKWQRERHRSGKVHICLLFLQGITFNTFACPPFAGFSQNLLFLLLQPHTPSTDLIYISPPESAVQFFEWRQPGARLKTMLKCYYNLFILMLMSKKTLLLLLLLTVLNGQSKVK